MSFFQWYASVNDDVRTELIDKAWFGKHIPQSSMQSAVNDNAPTTEQGQIAPEVYGKAPETPETIHQLGLHGQPENNPESTKNAIEAFYGASQQPSGNELGGVWQQEADYAAQQDQTAEVGPEIQQQEQEQEQ